MLFFCAAILVNNKRKEQFELSVSIDFEANYYGMLVEEREDKKKEI